MSNLFSQVLNMSMTGSVVILLVMLARLILKRAPKIFSYALWSVVLFRLLCPVAFTSPVSVLNALKPEVQEASESTSVVYFLPAEVSQNLDFTFVPAENQSGTEGVKAGESEHTHLDLITVISYVWIIGTGTMILYSVLQYIRLKLKVVGAMAYRGNVYRADYIDTPFVMGIFSPKIYLPSDVPMNERKYIIAHERHHIRRCDHIIKLLAYFSLCIHWFNPLVWVAFILAGKDMEMSCDEAVIQKMGSQIRADYSASLLRLATHKKIIAGMPLAFGEGDTKGRVMNMAKWKMPKLWVSLICLLMCATILVACAVNPEQEDTSSNQEPVAAFSDEAINILITVFSDEVDNTAPDSTVILSVNPDLKIITMGTVLKDTYVSLPDYQGHITGNHKFSVCYMLGKTWGGIDGAEEMVNQCVKDNFGIVVDYNMELTGTQFTGFMDILNDIAGKLESPLSAVQQNISDELLSMIAGTENLDKISDIKEKLAAAQWESCTIPFEGTYIGKEVDISGTKTYVLMMEESQDIIGSTGDTATISGAEIVTDTELVQYGTLKMLLPSGFAATQTQDVVVLTKDSVAVGGIRHWTYPDFQPSDIVELKKEETGAPIGYMSGSSAYGDTEYEVFWDGNPAGLCEQHTFFIDGDIIYDVWYDENQISDGIAERFLKTVAINADPLVVTEPGEQEAFAKCRAVLEAVQKGSYKVITRQTNGRNENAVSCERTYFRSDADWLSFTNVLAAGADFTGEVKYSTTSSRLCVNGKYFGFTGAEWVEIAEMENERIPWLAEFTWDENIVAYMDTLTDEDGECVMLRVDEQYIDSNDYDPHYFLFFNFDPDGNFVNAQLQVNLFRDNEINITESIASLDAEEINAEIQKEYQNAIG